MAEPTEEKAKSSRRTIKKVESVREKTDKAVESAGKPRRLNKTTRRMGAPFRAVGRGFKWLGKFKVMRAIGYVFFPPYFRNSWKELRQVTWPTFKVSLRLTAAVIIFAVVFGALVALLDFILDKVFKEVLLK